MATSGDPAALEVVPESPNEVPPAWFVDFLSEFKQFDSKVASKFDLLESRLSALESKRSSPPGSLSGASGSGQATPTRISSAIADKMLIFESPNPVVGTPYPPRPAVVPFGVPVPQLQPVPVDPSESLVDRAQKHAIGAQKVLFSPASKQFVHNTPPHVRAPVNQPLADPAPQIHLAAAQFRVDQAGFRVNQAFYPDGQPPPPPRPPPEPDDTINVPPAPPDASDVNMLARLKVKLSFAEIERDELRDRVAVLLRERNQLQQAVFDDKSTLVSALHALADKESTPVRVEKFTGKGDTPLDVSVNAQLYLAALSRVHKEKDSDAKKVKTFLSGLSDHASVWSLTLPPGIAYSDLVDRFSLRFGVAQCHEHALAEFNGLSRGSSSLESHVQKFQKLASVLSDMPVANLKQKFCNSLGPTMGVKLYSDSQYPHMCLEDLFAAARRLETATLFGSFGAASPVASSASFNASPVTPAVTAPNPTFVFGQSSSKPAFGKPAFTTGYKAQSSGGFSQKPRQIKVQAVMAPELSNTTTSAPFPEKESGVEWDCAVEDSTGKLWWWDGSALRPVFETVEQ